MSSLGTRQYGARQALIVLTAINFLNFADRYVPSSVKSLIQADLNLNDFESSLPSTGMVLVYMFFAPMFGMLNDKKLVDRRYLIWGAIVFWSLATSLAGFAQNLTALVLIRSLVGVGEAAYTTIAPPMLFDFYPYQERAIIMGIYFLAVPIGGALGFAVGSGLGGTYGWRVAFYAIGVPGIVAAMFVLRLQNPPVGVNDERGDDHAVVLGSSSSSSSSGLSSSQKSISFEVVDSSQSPLRSKALLPVSSMELFESESLSHHQQDHHPSLIDSNTSTISTGKVPHHGKSHPESASATSETGVVLTVLDLHVARDWRARLWLETRVALSELWEIVCIKPFLFAVLGSAANSFGSGGLADWLPVFMLRYLGTDVTTAGLLVGAATVVGGIGGTTLGAKVAEHYLRRVKSAFFLVPALFTLPAAALLLVALNVTSSVGLTGVLLILSQIMFWTATAPISALAMNVVPPRLRARSCGVLILVQHVLGDVISPPLIGYCSDSLGSLQTALQMTWIAVLVSGAWWMAGYYFLDPLLVDVAGADPADTAGHAVRGDDDPSQQTAEEGFIDRHGQSVATPPEQLQRAAVATYRDVLFGPEATSPAATTNINTTVLRTI